ncbi:hypothetical protein [Faecalicatena orotica]
MREEIPDFNGIIVIDQDKSATDIMEDLLTGYQYLEQMIRVK